VEDSKIQLALIIQQLVVDIATLLDWAILLFWEDSAIELVDASLQ